jgi:hypothetical protein
MPARTARLLKKQPTKACLEEDLRALVALAVRVTEQPDQIAPEDYSNLWKGGCQENGARFFRMGMRSALQRVYPLLAPPLNLF